MLAWLSRRNRKKRLADIPQADSATPSGGAAEKEGDMTPPAESRCPLVSVGRAPAVNPELYPKACRIARSLREAPEEWQRSADGLTLQHVHSGYTIWIANDNYKMGERVKTGPRHERTIPYDAGEALIIWPAVEAALKNIDSREASEFFDRPEKARLWPSPNSDGWLCQDLKGKLSCVGVGKTTDEAYRVWLALNYPRYREEATQGRPILAWRG